MILGYVNIYYSTILGTNKSLIEPENSISKDEGGTIGQFCYRSNECKSD